jgi:hypothetical protein
MPLYLLLGPLLLAIAAWIWVYGTRLLVYRHVRSRTFAMHSLLHATGALAIVISVLAANQTALAVGLALGGGATLLIPDEWLIRLGGLEQKWELRRVRGDASDYLGRQVTAQVPADVTTMNRYFARMRALRAPDTAEFCDLAILQMETWLTGRYMVRDKTLLAVRLYEVEVELFGQEHCLPIPDRVEATFRYRLLKTFIQLNEMGDERPTDDAAVRFASLLTKLDGFRRPDTLAFIDAVERSAREWVTSSGPDQGWGGPDGKFSEISPIVDKEYWALWPNADVFWGAAIDAEDRAAVEDPAFRLGPSHSEEAAW